MAHAEDSYQAEVAGRRLNGEARHAVRASLGAPVAGQIMPVPGATVAGTVRRRRRRKPKWYRRPLFIIPIVLLLLVAGGLTTASLIVGSTLSTVQTLSTPPPQISGDAFGVDKRIEIDTGPARAAVASTGAKPSQSQAGGAISQPAGTKKTSSGGGFWGGVKSTLSGAGSMTSGAAAAVGITSQVQPDQGTNILLMGVDARPGQAIDIGVRPDALMVLHLNPETGSCRVLAIPRDTRTELPGYGLTKVNHALAVGGIPYERQVVENLLGISIQHYGLIDFSGLTDLVNAVGGVTVDNPYAFSLDGMDFAAGPIELDGAHALTYSRYRYGPDGDFGRVKKQQQVIRALMKKGAGLGTVTELNKLLPALQDHTRTDLTLPQMVVLAQQYGTRCTDSSIQMTELQGTVATYPDPLLKMDLSYVIVQPQEIKDKVAWLLGS